MNASSPEIGVLAGEVVEHLQPALEGLAEPLLLGLHDPLDLGGMLDQLGEGAGDLLDHDRRQPVDVREPDPVALLHGPADEPADDVAAPLVRRRDPLGDQEHHRATVVGEHAMRLRRLLGVAVGDAGLLGDPAHDRLVAVGVEDRADVLQQHGAALEPEARVDVLLRQRRQRAVGGEVVLHEDEVPELEDSARSARSSGRRSGRRSRTAARGRRRSRSTARTGRCRRPARSSRSAAARRCARAAGRRRSQPWTATSSSPRPSSGSPANTVAQSRSGAKPMCSVTNSQANGIASVLEVVAEREVAEHLEERGVPRGRADVVEVGVLAAGAHHLLRGDDARGRAAARHRGTSVSSAASRRR